MSSCVTPYVPAGKVHIQVSVPAGAVPGTVLTIAAPNGQQVQITVPDGVAAHSVLTVEVPSAASTMAPAAIPTAATPGVTTDITPAAMPTSATPTSATQTAIPSVAPGTTMPTAMPAAMPTAVPGVALGTMPAAMPFANAIQIQAATPTPSVLPFVNNTGLVPSSGLLTRLTSPDVGQPLLLGPPLPVRMMHAQENQKPAAQVHLGGDPIGDPRRWRGRHMQPHSRGAAREVDFNKGESNLPPLLDPLGPVLGSAPKLLELSVDPGGAEADVKRYHDAEYRCCCIFGTLCFPFTAGVPLCWLACQAETKRRRLETLRSMAGAHSLTLHQGVLVYERRAHQASVVENFVSRDQYGNKYASAGENLQQIAAARVHVPLRYATLEVYVQREITPPPIFLNACVLGCLGKSTFEPTGKTIMLRCGSPNGVQIAIGSVDCGPNANVDAFVQAFEAQKAGAGPLPPELEVQYRAWFNGMLHAGRAGTMLGSAAPKPVEGMERGGSRSFMAVPAEPYTKVLGPIPVGPLGVTKHWGNNGGRISQVGIRGVHYTPPAVGMYPTTDYPTFSSALDNGDLLLRFGGMDTSTLSATDFAKHLTTNPAEHAGGAIAASSDVPRWLPCSLRATAPMPIAAVAGLAGRSACIYMR